MKLQVQKRELLGKKVKSFRNQGLVPASVYGPEIKPTSLVVNEKDFKKIYKDLGYSSLFDLEVEGEKPVNVLIKEVQINPVNDKLIHVSFYQVNMKKEIVADIPLEFSGESLAVKNNLGLLVTQLDTITVQCLPKDLPSHLEISLSTLVNVGDSVLIKDLKLPEGVTLTADMLPETPVCYIATPQKIEDIEAEEAAEKAAEAEAAVIEGEAAEGAESTEEAKAESTEEK